MNRSTEENLAYLKKHYGNNMCPACDKLISRYNLQFYFDSNVLQKPDNNIDLSKILAKYCDHSFCHDCLSLGIKEKFTDMMKNKERISFENFTCPINIFD
jgi:hypothetical protein